MGDATALLFHRHFGIPMLFLRDLIPVTYLRTLGNARFVRKNKEGKKISIDGYYQLSANYMEDRFSYTWFSQSLQKGKTSNYFIHGCPTETRRLIMECANGSTPLGLARSFSIDAFLINDTVTRMNNLTIEYREPLILLEKTLPAELLEYESTPQVNNVVRLHLLLRKFQLMKDTLETVSGTLDFVIETLSVLSSLWSPDLDAEDVEESLSLIQCKASWSIRQLSNLEDRSNVRIALLYNLENQRDSQINLKIARLTAQISMVSQKDSSAMITLVEFTLGLLYSFTVPIFPFLHTVFFITSADGNLSVAPLWWLFPAITIPLTVIVFLTWTAWFRRRHTIGANSLSVADLQVGMDLPTPNPVLPPLHRHLWASLFGHSRSRVPSSPGVVNGYKDKKDV
ncbi:hypothetical protein GALMADRAFT_159511 [Galerina marginata CBS 339.88]|uniref:Uncharacterized protein n=1 Tax=Galerina marginata (strain CBS 339.88) TaxID=685588 RepID=A0A067SK73_GALM3|nr:hypothetical protein GALMADRAFT_159511 [Galerina marginata CBS 339.88]